MELFCPGTADYDRFYVIKRNIMGQCNHREHLDATKPLVNSILVLRNHLANPPGEHMNLQIVDQ